VITLREFSRKISPSKVRFCVIFAPESESSTTFSLMGAKVLESESSRIIIRYWGSPFELTTVCCYQYKALLKSVLASCGPSYSILQRPHTALQPESKYLHTFSKQHHSYTIIQPVLDFHISTSVNCNKYLFKGMSNYGNLCGTSSPASLDSLALKSGD